MAAKLNPIHSRHIDVHKQDIGRNKFNLFKTLYAVPSDGHGEAFGDEDGFKNSDRLRVIFYEKNFGAGQWTSGGIHETHFINFSTTTSISAITALADAPMTPGPARAPRVSSVKKGGFFFFLSR